MLQAHPVCSPHPRPGPAVEAAVSPRSPGSFRLRVVFRSQSLDTECIVTVGCCSSQAFFVAELRNVCVYVCEHTLTPSIYVHRFYPYMCTYWKSQVHTDKPLKSIQPTGPFFSFHMNIFLLAPLWLWHLVAGHPSTWTQGRSMP